MKKVAIVFSIILLGGFLTYLFSGTKPAAIEKDSPAFSLALDTAVKTLEGVTTTVTTGARVAEARGSGSNGPTSDPFTCDPVAPTCQAFTSDPLCWITFDKAPTCTPPGGLTCDAGMTCKSGYYTCDSRYTCDGTMTCSGSWSCWNSTCNWPNSTCQGTVTCDGGPYCCFTVDGTNTCNGTPECLPNTVNGWPTCHQVGNPGCAPSATDRTTWGDLKVRFKD